ncbi:MAG: hypothetical protein JHD16_06570 [Solirubrobacteraceae bacterium]|nr:hypothetical protein [Solirubrobacteraceae bacterium]
MSKLHITLRATLLALTASAAVTPVAGASVLHVTGGTGNCSTTQLGCELADALATAQTGDIIQVHAGVHGINGVVADSQPGVTIQGAPDESRPVLAMSGTPGGLHLTHGTDLSGLDLVSTSDAAITAFGGLLERIRVSASGAGRAGVQLGDGAILRNSTVTASGANSIGVLVSTGGQLTQLRGSSVVATGSGSSALLVAPVGPGATSSLRAVNSILHGYGGGFDARAVTSTLQTATVVLDHSASSRAAQQVVGPGSAIDDSRSPVTAEPLFLDRGNLDLRQTAASPTIDAGTADLDGDGDVDAADADAAGALDLDGTPRRLGHPDVGADEREMPPIVLSAEPIITGGKLKLRVVVQPRGLATVVTAEWTTEGDNPGGMTSADATGNAPVSIDLPLADVPAGSQIAVRAYASNSAGTSSSEDTTVATPLPEAPAPTDSASITTATEPAAAVSAVPMLIRTTLSRWGILKVRLLCNATVPCRGEVILTRLGTSKRWVQFGIEPGKAATVGVPLTSAQSRQLRRAGKRGVRSLLELRTPTGSSFTAIRIVKR